jgi:hypothetical protein
MYLLRFGHHRDVAVIKAHRHFDLAPSEAMVETQEGDQLFVSRPVLVEKLLLLPPEKEGDEATAAVPNVIALMPEDDDTSSGRRWFPVNFGNLSSNFF